MFQLEEGWNGAFTRNRADNALPNGTRIVKSKSEFGDATPEGTPGVVLGSISHPDIWEGAVCYFVEWAYKPRTAVAIMGTKIREAE